MEVRTQHIGLIITATSAIVSTVESKINLRPSTVSLVVVKVAVHLETQFRHLVDTSALSFPR